MKENSNDRFEEVFGGMFSGMEPENPPCDLDRKIMSRIDNHITKRALRRQWFYMLSLPILGVAAIVGSLFLIVKFMKIDIHISIPRIEIDPATVSPYIIPVLCALLLLMADTLIRKRIEKKRHS